MIYKRFNTQKMKTFFCFLFLLLISDFIHAQDTIFMKSGAQIPAIIKEIGDVEIKYKKYNQSEETGIYTVFIYEVASLHYKNGTVVDYNRAEIYEPGKSRGQGPNTGSSVLMAKFSFGLSQNFFKRDASDNLEEFWRYFNNNSYLRVGGNPNYRAINLAMNAELGGNHRNWIGAQLQLIGTPKNSIYASFNNNEIKLRTYHYNISMFYGRSINYKKNLIFIFEPSMDLAQMSGNLKFGGVNYRVTSFSGIASHFALGLDWNISKRLSINLRAGKRFMKIDEVHKSAFSSTGYQSFYVNPEKDLLYVKWSGAYVGIGASFSIYGKINGSRPSS
jgi:hypothetical protein